jgi:transcriptional regulator with XRE-family HTH domain
MSIAEQIGQKIRSIRESKGLTQEQVHQRSGVSASFLSLLETSKTDVGLQSLEALAQALEVSLPDLVNEKLPTKHILSRAALTTFCEQDKIDSQERASLEEELESGIVSFTTPEDWKDHYNGLKFRQARRPSLTQLHGGVQEAPDSYRARRKPRGVHRRKP